jgi:hypothetical protein
MDFILHEANAAHVKGKPLNAYSVAMKMCEVIGDIASSAPKDDRKQINDDIIMHLENILADVNDMTGKYFDMRGTSLDHRAGKTA